jgi:hypothetical protein
MLKTLFALDYSPLFADAKRTPVMVTLTYPGEWESVAPNGQATKRHLSMFRKLPAPVQRLRSIYILQAMDSIAR